MGPWGAIAGAAAGTLGSLFGSMGKNESVARQKRNIEKLQAENKDWLNRQYGGNPTQRLEAQRMITKLEDIVKRRNDAAEARRVLTGGTEESVNKEKEGNNQMMADAVSQIAAKGDALNEMKKERAEQAYLNRKNKLDDLLLGVEAEKQGIGDILGNAIGGSIKGMQAGSSLGGFGGFGGS